jgi:hypothetical protein
MTFKTSPANPPLARPGVYAIVEIPTGRRYIGASQNVLRRVRAHATDRKRRDQLYRLIRLYGTERFRIEPLYYASAPHDLTDIETALIDTYGTLQPDGFNKTREFLDQRHRGAISRGVRASRLGKRWVTDGEHNRSILADDPVPAGWRYGKTIRVAYPESHAHNIASARAAKYWRSR